MSGEHVLYLLAFAFLAASAAIDIRSRKLSVAFLAASAAAAAAAGAFLRQDGVAGILLSLLPAAVLLSASIMSRGGIGAGDGCAAAVLGFLLTFEEMMVLLGFTMAASFIYAAVLFLRRKGRDASFPLMPFMLAGYLGMLALAA